MSFVSSVAHILLITSSIASTMFAVGADTQTMAAVLVFAAFMSAAPPILTRFTSASTAMRVARWSAVGATIVVVGFVTQDIFGAGLNVDEIVPPNHLLGLFLILVLCLHYSTIGGDVADEQSLLEHALGGPSLLLATASAATLTTATLLVLGTISVDEWPIAQNVRTIMLERGWIPPTCLWLFFWAVSILFTKGIALARETLELGRVQRGQDAKYGSTLVSVVVSNVAVSRPRALLDRAWQVSEDSYGPVRYASWAIPILGFVGTVIGISQSVGAMQHAMVGASQSESLTTDLASAISPLSLAFDTTLAALMLSVVLVFQQILLQRAEARLLTQLDEYVEKKSVAVPAPSASVAVQG